MDLDTASSIQERTFGNNTYTYYQGVQINIAYNVFKPIDIYTIESNTSSLAAKFQIGEPRYDIGSQALDTDLVSQILSTFEFTQGIQNDQFTDAQTSETKSSASATTYKPGSDWQTVNHSNLDISVCLPPKWEFGTHGNGEMNGYIYFARDSQYRPDASFITSISYSGGSRSEEYINSKVQYEPDPETLKSQTTVKEWYINGKSFLEISIPSFPQVLVTALNNQLYAIGIDYDPMVNDSQTAFRQDIFTMAGCLKVL
jgi:hypothetical protein